VISPNINTNTYACTAWNGREEDYNRPLLRLLMNFKIKGVRNHRPPPTEVSHRDAPTHRSREHLITLPVC
jgi:hypothetical protein